MVADALRGEDAGAWRIRTETAVCLSDIPAFDALTHVSCSFHAGENTLLSALGIREAVRIDQETVTWLWRGVPIAVSSDCIGLEPPVPSAGTDDALAELSEELSQMKRLSPIFQGEAAGKL